MLTKLREPKRLPNIDQGPAPEPPGRGNEGGWTKATKRIAAEAQAKGDKVTLARLFAAMDKRAKKLKRAKDGD